MDDIEARLARHQGLILKYARRYWKSLRGFEALDLEDIVAELTFSAWRALLAHDPARGTESTIVSRYLGNRVKRFFVDFSRVRRAPTGTVVSLDAPPSRDDAEGDRTLGDMIEDELRPGPEALALARIEGEALLAKLPPEPWAARAAVILRARAQGLTLGEAAEVLGEAEGGAIVSRERARQLEARALARIRTLAGIAEPAAPGRGAGPRPGRPKRKRAALKAKKRSPAAA